MVYTVSSNKLLKILTMLFSLTCNQSAECCALWKYG